MRTVFNVGMRILSTLLGLLMLVPFDVLRDWILDSQSSEQVLSAAVADDKYSSRSA